MRRRSTGRARSDYAATTADYADDVGTRQENPSDYDRLRSDYATERATASVVHPTTHWVGPRRARAATTLGEGAVRRWK
jgi:hypothetical protein